MSRYSLFAAAISVIWAMGGLFSMSYGTNYNWPDFVHVDYGFPFTYATHTLNTIVGPIDRWSLDIGSLTGDLAFWLAGMVIIIFVALYLEGRSRRPAPQAAQASG